MEYRRVATSVEGFVQQLAVAYITHGYWFYVAGEIPEGKDPAVVDSKLIERYGITISKWARCRRKKQGLANMQYLRHERFFVLLATKGQHEFFERERASFRDVRRVPIKFAGYSIACKKGRDGRWHASVRISREHHAGLKALLVEIGLRRGTKAVAHEFARLQYQPYAPVRRQMLGTLRAVNRARRTAGMGMVGADCLPLRRRIENPFGEAVADASSVEFGNL
ncbi:hypothetical protein RAS2_09740 [Phycisphaerae bacterium RAS2]|nr:hypothetical protein RAS2_09740 [Phycisphaerae bacterium RAS2]